MKLAVVFPGQGSQYVGMGSEWLDQPPARAVFDQADAALGASISRLCFEGPEEELKLTANTQPAILATSLAVFECIRGSLPEISCFAGHSLGEYTALVASGSLGLEGAVRTVNERGRHMQTAVPVGKGAMAAVMRLDSTKIDEINRQVNKEFDDPVEVANYNSLEQVVVSGGAEAVHRAVELYLEAGAKRAVELPVSAPFHSSLMIPAADALMPTLQSLEFVQVQVPVVANLTAGPYPEDPSQYPLILHAQIFNPVRWTDTVSYLVAQDVTHLLEVGPGRVLRMLAVKINNSLKTLNIDKPADLEGLDGWLAGEAHA